MKKLLNSCQKSTELIDKQLSTALTATEKLQLNAHKALCTTCSAYAKQSKLLDAAFSRMFLKKNVASKKMDADKKQKIVNAIKEVQP
ncbi:hypothetical protein [Flavobacterium sp. 14A]|uniref:hypothetical protein n=1 Tax=Flavobacterium sp. 14A TaxID=2735896 RepID=UPI00156DCFB1|nr:hypothetical protein [Flavobacterium sp. 14A]NRT12501.1 hypothetical protein [Flavobacterium sp. 14A]